MTGVEPDDDRQRVGDAERESAVELLRAAVGDGRLDLTELDARVEAAYAARTRVDLAAVVDDLRPATPASTPAPADRPASGRHVAVLSRRERGGAWRVPARSRVVAVLGTVLLDLRQADLAAAEVVLTVHAVLGGVTVHVGPRTRVEVEGSGVLGGFTGPSGLVAAQLDDSSPTVRIRGLALAGGVRVERRQERRPGSA